MWTCTTSLPAWWPCMWASSAEIPAGRRRSAHGLGVLPPRLVLAWSGLLPGIGHAQTETDVGMLTSVAAGLGLSRLTHSLGWGTGAAEWLLALGVAVLLGGLAWRGWRRRAGPGQPTVAAAPDRRGREAARSFLASSEYDPSHFAPESSVRLGRGADASAGERRAGPWWGVPEGFDSAGFLDAAKRNFVVLQQAWDAADLARLGELMTDDMLANVRAQLAERGDQPNRTDVVTLQATLLGVEDLGAHYLASVEFSGMIREEVSAGASPFREIWNLTKARDGHQGWLLAGVQALQ